MQIMAIQNNKRNIFCRFSVSLLMLVNVSVCQKGGVASIVSSDFFNSIIEEDVSVCGGKGFYDYDSFINASNAFEGFGTSGSSDQNKREVAAFLANAAHETVGLCVIEEQHSGSSYCDATFTEYPCNPNKSYQGRGPMQLSWNYNYGPAGDYLGFDGLNHPEAVSTNSIISFETALWHWMVNSNCHTAITSGQGFGGTIRAINAIECDGGSDAAVSSRVNYYQKFCQKLNVDPGSNLRCGQESIQKPIQKTVVIYLTFVLI